MENKTKKELIILTELEENVKQQLMNVYNHPKAVGKTIAFPDCHLGKGIPIGCLAILDNAISPNMVGSDIGCGVSSCQLRIKKCFFTIDEWKEIANEIRTKIPFGFNWHKQPHDYLENVYGDVFQQKINEVKLQVGTLGGGNHFIEFETDACDYVWLTIHCGSRNIGKVINEHYDKIAQNYMEKIGKKDLVKQGLSYLEGVELEKYAKDMWDCIVFAGYNRRTIKHKILDIIGEKMWNKLDCVAYDGEYDQDISRNLTLTEYESIHNYCEKDGTLFIHRKGCINMTKKAKIWYKKWWLIDNGDIIVGSQGTCSYIVEPTEFANDVENTCSHGAGRVLGRGEAKRTLSLEKELEILEKQHIIHALRGKEQLDEATSAYKDIDKVIAQQKKYIKVIKKLKPFIVLKG